MPFEIRPGSLSQTPVLLLAGGRGDRLDPLTLKRPKALLPLGAFRVLDFTLLNCQTSRLLNLTLLTQYKHDQIASYVQEKSENFRCLPPSPGKRYEGTADAVFQNLSVFSDGSPRHALILPCDHVCRMDYRKLLRHHMESESDLTIATTRLPINQASYGGLLNFGPNARR